MPAKQAPREALSASAYTGPRLTRSFVQRRVWTFRLCTRAAPYDPVSVKAHTVYRTFLTEHRREFVRITEDVDAAVRESGIAEGMVLVAAMHITAGVWINDDEPGIQADTLEWLDKLAPPSWKEPDGKVAEALLPNPGDYRHHRGGEDNGDAHMKNLLVHHQVIVPVTEGRLDLGPWQQVFYCEFDGGRPKRLVIKVMGE
jgi:secondary thiamine-phosphate synthase enzyme